MPHSTDMCVQNTNIYIHIHIYTSIPTYTDEYRHIHAHGYINRVCVWFNKTLIYKLLDHWSLDTFVTSCVLHIVFVVSTTYSCQMFCKCRTIWLRFCIAQVLLCEAMTWTSSSLLSGLGCGFKDLFRCFFQATMGGHCWEAMLGVRPRSRTEGSRNEDKCFGPSVGSVVVIGHQCAFPVMLESIVVDAERDQ